MFKVIALMIAFLPLALGGISLEAAQPLEGRSLDNLVVFVRLVGYVHYFYPGDVAAQTDWDAFTAAYIETVEQADSAEQLAQQLTSLFTPYAPDVQVYPSGEQPELPAALQQQPESAAYITMWVHIPLAAVTAAGIDRNYALADGDRVQVPLNTAEFEYGDNAYLQYYGRTITIAVHDPAQPYRVELGGGVSAAIPLALYGDDTGTLPHTPPPQPSATEPDQRSIQFAAVAAAWNAIQHFFPYWDVLQSNWEEALRTALTEAAVADEETFLPVLRRVMALIHDGHSFTTHGGFPGPGPYLLPFTWDMVENQLVVTTTLEPASPLSPGDIVTTIDNVPAREAINQVLEMTSPAGGYGMFQALSELASGQPQETTTLEIRPVSGKSPYMVTVGFTHRVQNIPAEIIRENRPSAVADLGSGAVYVDLTRISQGEMTRALSRLTNAEAVILDMRGYPDPRQGVASLLMAYLTDEPLTSPPIFMPVVTRPDHQDMQFVDFSSTWVEPAAPHLTDNIAWLINGNATASYAESIMGIVEGYQLGAIVGIPSAGVNGNAVSLSLPGGYRTQWSSMQVTKFDGSPLFDVGVIPNVLVERTLAGVAAGRDEVLERAFELLTGHPASAIQTSP